MSSSIILPGQENADRLAAVRTYARLQGVKPSPAAPLTDEDMAIFERQAERCGRQFMIYASASYREYFVFFGGEMGRALDSCREKL